ncbi:hypothetical protein [Vogesella sp. XCS3]|uniref:hypothetical protein n=1 Tax=Vogesella sp. XCS3 TaxID=2877939 RepID=UPI001D0B3D98|nr:hypothetical protein [Vogesella sp. XCS3]UDM16953.1 hypothetical protein LCH97_17005 [Vogesella sp. XCS3]
MAPVFVFMSQYGHFFACLADFHASPEGKQGKMRMLGPGRQIRQPYRIICVSSLDVPGQAEPGRQTI